MKIRAIISAILLVGLLTGCSAETEIRKQLSENLNKDENYSSYLALKEGGLLNEENQYISPNKEAQDVSGNEEMSAACVRVTFARNNLINVKYYLDEELTKEIDTSSECLLEPGTSIYAGNAVVSSEKSGIYELTGFNVFLYEDGNRKIMNSDESTDNGLIFQLTDELVGSTIAIEPVGAYNKRTIFFHAYKTTGDNGKTSEIFGGTWTINDIDQASSKEAEISPMISYTVGYKYIDGSDTYYVEKTEPDYFGNLAKNDTLSFEFEQTTTDKHITDYTVWLHEYYKILFSCNDSEAFTNDVQISGASGTRKETAGNPIHKLRENDEVIVTLDKDYSLMSEDIDIPTPERTEDKSVYRLIIGGDKQALNVSVKSTLEIHSIQKFYDKKGGKLLSASEINDNDTIWYEITPDEDYYLIKNQKSLTGKCKYSKYKRELNKLLSDNMRECIAVKLPTEDSYGKFSYRQGDIVVNVGTDNIAKIKKEDLEMTYELKDPQNYTLYKKDSPNDILFNFRKPKSYTTDIKYNDIISKLENGQADDFRDYAGIAVKVA